MNELPKTQIAQALTISDVMNMPTCVIRLPKLLTILGISRSTVYLKINQGSKYYDKDFPKPIKLGDKAIGWILQDVMEYIESMKMGTKCIKN